ncbi:hypothetical protein [Paludibacterium purpuratum]|uniref:hypothetical protein n=1 Tax=Paludibacterium purpuratum TaxID=1144873 RepID=UPI00105C35FE|nr:hypothetical protein [Paludibacterium purpuratum]
MRKTQDIQIVVEALEVKRSELIASFESLKMRRLEIEREMQSIEVQISELDTTVKVLFSIQNEGVAHPMMAPAIGVSDGSEADSVAVNAETSGEISRKRQSQKPVIAAMSDLLKCASRPLSISEIYEALVAGNVEMNYEEPQLRLSKMLSAGKQFKNLRGQGWVLS